MKNKKMLYLMYIIIFVAAFGYIMYSALMTPLRLKHSLTITQGAMIGSCLSAGQIAILLLNGVLSKKVNKRTLITLGVVLHIISLTLVPIATNYIFLLCSFFLNGMVCSLLNVVMCSVIADQYPEERNKYINGFHAIYGMGSLVGPLLPSFLLAQNIKWEIGYFAIVGIAVLLLAIWLRATREMQEVKAGQQSKEKTPFFLLLLFKKPFLPLVCLCGILLIGFDMIISTWMTTFMEEKLQVSSSLAAIIITCYWLGTSLGRVIYSAVFSRIDSRKYMVCTNLICAVVLSIGLVAQSIWLMFAVIVIVGILVSTNYPLCISLACGMVPDNTIGGSNTLCFCASIGGMLFPMIAGRLIDAFGYHMLIVLGVAMLLLLVAIMLLLLKIMRQGDAEYV